MGTKIDKVNGNSPLWQTLDYDKLTEDITLQNLYTFTYGNNTNVEKQPKLSSKEEIQTVINNSIKAFNKFMEEDGKKLDKFQQEKEEKLFYTFLYAMEKIWTGLLDDTEDKYNKVLTALQDPSGNQEQEQNKSILQPYFSKETLDQAKSEAVFKAVPLKAVGQQLASYFAGPTDKFSRSLEKLIKLWVPYRFLYYTVYDEDPNQIENFKDKIFEFETEQKVSTGSFDRMMLAFIQLLQMASINEEYQKAILTDLNSIFGPAYPITKKGGNGDKIEVVAYVEDIYKKLPKPNVTAVINASQKLTEEMKQILLDLFTNTEEALKTKREAEQVVATGAMDAILNALDMGVAVSKVEDLLKALALQVTGKKVEGTSESDKVVEELVKMLTDSVLRVEGLLKSVKGVAAQPSQTAVPPPLEPEPVISAPPPRDLVKELEKLYPNSGCTEGDVTSNNNIVEQIIEDTKAVRSFFTKDINTPIIKTNLDDFYRTGIITGDKITADDLKLDCTNLSTLKDNLKTLKSHIDTLSKVRVVLSFNEKTEQDTTGIEKYKNDIVINDIIGNNYQVNGSNITPFYRYLSNTKTADINSFTDDIKKDIETATTTANTNIIYTGYGHSGSGKTYTLTEAANANNVLGVIFNELEGKKDVTLSVYELYGEDKDAKCTEASLEEIYEYNLESIKSVNDLPAENLVEKVNSKTELKNTISITSITDAELTDLVNKINAIRLEQKRIIKTPNNPDSSRGHMFYEFMVPVNGSNSKITVIDMGGIEDVDKIEESYKTVTIDTYNEEEITKYIGTLPTEFSNIKDTDTLSRSTISKKLKELNTGFTDTVKGAQLKENYTISDISKGYDTKLGEKVILSGILSYIKDNILFTKDSYTFTIADTFTGYITKASKDTTAKQYFSGYSSNPVTELNKIFIQDILEKYYEVDDTSTQKTVLYTKKQNIQLNSAEDILTAFLSYIILKNHSLFWLDKLPPTGSGYKNSINRLNALRDILDASKQYSYSKQPSEYPFITTLERGLNKDTLEKQYTELKDADAQLKEIRCPLRRQGNYINHSIKDLKDFTYNLAGITNPAPPQQAQTKLKELLPTLTQPNSNNNTKLTIIAALRTDDAHKEDMNKTLYFAHCINPFSNKTGEYIKCTDPENMQGGKSKKQKAGAPQPTPPPEPPTNPIATLQAKLTEDIDTVKSYLKKSNELKQVLADVTSTWKSYTSVTTQKSFKDLKIYTMLDGLIEVLDKKIEETNPERLEKAKRNNIYAVFNTIYNYKGGNPSSTEKNYFIDERKKFVALFNELVTALDNNRPSLNETLKENLSILKTISEILKFFNDTPTPSTDDKLTTVKEKYITPLPDSSTAINTENLVNFLKEIKADYNTVPGYTAEEVKGTYAYLQKSAEPLKKDLVDKLTKVSTDYSKLIEELTKQAKKYAEVNPSIKNKVLLLLEPKDGSPSSVSKIMERINYLMGKMKADIDINKSSFEKAAEGMKSDRKSGGGYLLCNHEFLMQGGNKEEIEKDRIEITDVLLNSTATDKESIYKYINEFETLTKTFVNNLQKSTDPTYALTTQGNDSLFNTLFNKYRESKADTSKGEYQAALELSEGLEANNLLPRKVLAISYLDKTVFIFATLFIRLIALTIIDYLIDHNKLKRLSFTFLAYLGIYIGIFYVLLLVINLDDYKLRIVFNYMNMHANASVAALHPALVAVFGGIIYYVMLNINKGYGYTVANDEDRVRLKYKIQVLSLVIWMFTSLLVLLI